MPKYSRNDIDLYTDVCAVASLTSGTWAGLQWAVIASSFRPTHADIPNN